VLPIRHLLCAENTGFKKHLHGWIIWGEGGWSDRTAKVYAEVSYYAHLLDVQNGKNTVTGLYVITNFGHSSRLRARRCGAPCHALHWSCAAAAVHRSFIL